MRDFTLVLFLFVLAVGAVGIGRAPAPFETDTIKTSSGDLQITFIGHASLGFRYGKLVVYVDPVSQYADFAMLVKADIVLVTHEHGDHLDPKAIQALRTDKTVLVGTAKCASQVPGMVTMANGDSRTVQGLRIEAVPAYNIVNKRPTGEPFHARGEGNGYVITFGDKRVYVAGDTENTPEVKAQKNIDVAFLPMNLPYTMTPEMVADAAKAFAPKILYPYHYGDTDTSKLTSLLAGTPGIEVRIRNLK
jgi:L-ascorbate metabolism protein UlaG (beta-lactamase superfamily)